MAPARVLAAACLAVLLVAAPAATATAPAPAVGDGDGMDCKVVDTDCYDPNSKIPHCMVYVVLFCIPYP